MKVTISVKDKKLRKSSIVRAYEKVLTDTVNAVTDTPEYDKEAEEQAINMLIYGTSHPEIYK
jgi:hypothetical protein